MDDRDLYSGLIRLHILHHACEEPIFGAGISQELARHGYHLSPGTLYPLLHGLEQKGYLRSVGASNGRSTRRVYQATPKGRKALAAAKDKVRELFAELLEEKPGSESLLLETTEARALIKKLTMQLQQQVAPEPAAQALLDMSAEVLKGLLKAFDHYERRSETSV